jgi:hypothetical protein
MYCWYLQTTNKLFHVYQELGSIAVNGSPEQLDLSGTTTFHVKQVRMLA